MTFAPNDFLATLTPADIGIIAACLDDCVSLGDDDSFDKLTSCLFNECGLDFIAADDVAYHIIHDRKRTI